MKSLIFPTNLTVALAAGSVYPTQLFYSEYAPLVLQQTTSTNVNIGTFNNLTAFAVTVADDIDAAAFIQQINNAIGSSSVSSFCGGSPVAPVSLALTLGTNQVTLNWAAYTGATSYNIYRGTASGAEVFYSNSATNTFTDTVLPDGFVYYKVTAIFNGVESRQSNEVTTNIQTLTSVSPNPFNVGTDLTLTLAGSGFTLLAADYTMKIYARVGDSSQEAYDYTCSVSDANTIIATYSSTVFPATGTDVTIRLLKGGIEIANYLFGTIDNSGNITI